MSDSDVPDSARETWDSASKRSRWLTGSVRSAVFWLAMPVLGEQLLASCVGLFDMFLAGTLSEAALGAVGFSAYVDWLVGILFMLVGTGATALVARAVGEGDQALAQRTTNQAVTLAIGLGLVSTFAVIVGARSLNVVLGLEGEALDASTTYLRIVAIAHLPHAVTAIASACLRGAGNTVTPMWVIGMMNVVNIVVSSVLVLDIAGGPQMGITGVAVGTVVARVLGAAAMVYVLVRGKSGLSLRPAAMRPDGVTVSRIMRIGGPALADGTIMWGGHFVFMMIINRMVTEVEPTVNYAAHIVGIRIEMLSYLPAIAWSTAAATLVGQGLGARDPARARAAGHEAALQGTLLISAVGVGYFVFAPELFAVFTRYRPDAAVQAVGVPALRLIAFFQPALALMIIYVGALRGAGDTRYPLLFTFLGILFVRLPLGYLCGQILGGGLVGAWIGMAGDLTLRAALATWRFARGDWQRTRV